MKRKISKVLKNLALTVLILSCIVMPVNAEEGLSNLEATDYMEGLESLSSVSEEEWLDSANSAASVRNKDMEFIRVERSNQTTQEMPELSDIQKEDASITLMKGVSMIGNPIIEDIAAEDVQIENSVEDTYISGDLNDVSDVIRVHEERQEEDKRNTDSIAVDTTSTEGATEEEQKDDISENALREGQEDITLEDTAEKEQEDVTSEDAAEEQENTGLDNINEEMNSKTDVAEEESVYHTESGSNENIQEQSAPIAGLEAYVLNAETMKDENATTQTKIAWLFTGDADIYYYGGFQTGYIVKKYSDGFVTNFYTPGTYQILCYGENTDGEQSEMVGYTITVVSEFDCQTIEDSVSSATDSKSYSIDIDFTDKKAAAVCIVRTGKSNVQLKVTDENGNEIKHSSTTNKVPKRWIYIDKPSADAGICHYTVTVSAQSYDQESGAFRVMIGDKEDTEAMMGGLENAVEIDIYRYKEGNSINSTYSPNNDEYWFITSMPYPAVFTLLSDDSNLRYKLLDMDTLDVLFDSNDSRWEKMHSNRFTGSFSYAEKVNMKAFSGEKRYLVIYNNSPWSITGVREREFCFGVGQPMYGMKNEKVYGSSVTLDSSAYSSSSLKADASSFANTGVAYKAIINGVPVGNMEGWRLKGPESASYRSGIGKTVIEYMFTPGGSFNTKVRGTWNLGVKLKSGRPSVTCSPSVDFMFYYEYGDDTITIDYKE